MDRFAVKRDHDCIDAVDGGGFHLSLGRIGVSALSALNAQVSTKWPARTLAASGLLVAIAGGLWWAWDADPGWGRALVLMGVVVVLAPASAMTRRVAPSWILTIVGAVLAVFACYEVVRAIATILSQGAAHNL